MSLERREEFKRFGASSSMHHHWRWLEFWGCQGYFCIKGKLCGRIALQNMYILPNCWKPEDRRVRSHDQFQCIPRYLWGKRESKWKARNGRSDEKKRCSVMRRRRRRRELQGTLGRAVICNGRTRRWLGRVGFFGAGKPELPPYFLLQKSRRQICQFAEVMMGGRGDGGQRAGVGIPDWENRERMGRSRRWEARRCLALAVWGSAAERHK